MEPTALLVAFLAVASLAACISGRVTLDVVGILLLAVLIGSGIVDARTALSGFANSTVLTLAGLYVIGEALTRTGALEFVAVAATRAGMMKGTFEEGLPRASSITPKGCLSLMVKVLASVTP